MKQVNPTRYVVITPVRDEASYIGHTIGAMVDQTVLPWRWIIVDDGSSDGTGHIADEAALQHPWITVLHKTNRGFRKTGGGVMEAFYSGYRLVEDGEWDFIAKLDADLAFDADYFEKCFKKFEAEPKLGLGGGRLWEFKGEKWEIGSPGDPAFHVRGATKIYRRQCWFQIGGLIRELGWDTVDELKANMFGWRTYTFNELKLQHYKKTGSADGRLRHFVNAGRANYVTGYHPLFMAAKCIKRITRKPYCVGSIVLWAGFFSGYLKRLPRVKDETLIRWIREQQLRRLCFRASLWS